MRLCVALFRFIVRPLFCACCGKCTINKILVFPVTEWKRKRACDRERTRSLTGTKNEAKAWLRETFHCKINKNKLKFIYNMLCEAYITTTKLMFDSESAAETDLCQPISIHYTAYTLIIWVIITRRFVLFLLCVCVFFSSFPAVLYLTPFPMHSLRLRSIAFLCNSHEQLNL